MKRGMFNTRKEFTYSGRSSEVPLEHPTHSRHEVGALLPICKS